MRKPRDFDAELKALGDKARDLKSRKVQQLGELVRHRARRGAAFFQGRARRNAPTTDRNPDGPPAQPSGPQPASSRKGAM